MTDRTIGILSLIAGIVFGAISTGAILKPDEHLRLFKAQTLLSYEDRAFEILEATSEDPNLRLETLKKFETDITYFRDPSDKNIVVFFDSLEGHRIQAQNDIAARKAAANEAERLAQLKKEERAREEDRLKKEKELRDATRLRLERDLARERICLNQNCSDWILP